MREMTECLLLQTLEMIKKNEMELMSQAITYVMKTHKGEQVIETDDSLKLQGNN